MVNIKTYLSINFTKSFLTIFVPFFFIISLIYLVKISLLTAKIQITFSELIQLFSYYIPAIIFYALPISFIASVATVLLRLSSDNELIALFSLGYSVNRLIYPLLAIAGLFSILLFIISFGAMPQSKQLYASFKHVKTEEMAFNIIPEELGQKFGRHYIYIEDQEKDLYKNMVIFSQDKNNSSQIFSASKGDIKKNDGVFSLTLLNGKGYTFTPDTIQQIDYEKLRVFDTLSRSRYQFEEIGTYWKKSFSDDQRKRRLLFFLFVSLIPPLSLYIIASFTIINPRYQKNRSFVIIGLTTALFYTIASILNKVGTIWLTLSMIILCILIGYWLFHRTISRYF